jgi:8-oxo-dGTP diphosphatase
MADSGARLWGRYGAAGLLVWAPRPSGGVAVLLQRRAVWTDHGGTWGLPGGARRRGESAEQAALREAAEETGLRAEQIRVRDTVITSAPSGTDWTYTTVVADADELFATLPNAESVELRWVAEDDVAALPLHPGFAASWPQLRAVTGWRWWRVSPDGVLASPVDRILWPTAVFTACCQFDADHLVPAPGCTCGVYAFTRPRDVRGHMRATKLMTGLLPELRPVAGWPTVLGVVELSGGAVVAKRPPESACVELKARTARIVELFSDDQVLADRLGARYGVLVTTALAASGAAT